jgi:hypothetical protein
VREGDSGRAGSSESIRPSPARPYWQEVAGDGRRAIIEAARARCAATIEDLEFRAAAQEAGGACG